MPKPLTLLALVLVWSTSLSVAQPTDTLTGQVDALFAQWDQPGSPGSAVGLVQDGEVLYKRGYGMANLDYDIPITSATVFDIASVSKQFCAYAIAMLAEQGKLSLDDDIRKHIPEVPDFGTTITIRHLVHHTSGLRDWPGTLAMGGWRMEDVISFEQILTMVRHQEALNFEPGAEYSYSNTGYNLLAEVVARVTGQTFRAWTEAHIFKPLGMTHTHFLDDREDVIKHRAYAYSPSASGFDREGNGLTALGSSSLFTSIDDLVKWVNNFRDPRVGGPAVAAQVHQQGVLNDGETISYAFGQSVSTYRGLKTVAHSGSWAGFRTYLVRFPDQDFAVIVLSNVSTGNPTTKAQEIAELYLGDQMEPEIPSASSPAAIEPYVPSATDLDELPGTYYSDELESTYTLTVKDGVLMAHHNRHDDATLSPTSADTFTTTHWFMPSVAFKRDRDRHVSGFAASNSRSRNVWFEKVR